jgi:chromosome segregation ATPase
MTVSEREWKFHYEATCSQRAKLESRITDAVRRLTSLRGYHGRLAEHTLEAEIQYLFEDDARRDATEERLTEELRAATERIDELTAKVVERQGMVDHWVRALNQALEERDDRQARVAELADRLDSTRRELDLVRADLAISSTEHASDDAKARIDQLTEELAEANGNAAECAESLIALMGLIDKRELMLERGAEDLYRKLVSDLSGLVATGQRPVGRRFA